MRRRTGFQSAIRNPKSKIGFTLVELLVVIGIIVLLIGILMPVLRGVRQSAHFADSQQQISRLSTAIEAYYADHRAYPGPLSNDWIITGGPRPGDIPVRKSAGGNINGRIQMSENMVLGLLGGLKLPSGTSGTAPSIEYDDKRIADRMGAMNLNAASPKAGRAYLDLASGELSDAGTSFNGDRRLGGPEAEDSEIPEVLDRFPDGLPVLFLRARRGAPGVISDNNRPGVYQYDIQQIIGYVGPGNDTGIGGNGPHGLKDLGGNQLVTDPNLMAPESPWGKGGKGQKAYSAVPYFTNPQLTRTPFTNLNGTPRQKDGYILISPGKDRVYGTRDDITNFGGIQ